MDRFERINNRAETSEKFIEKYLTQKAKAVGGLCLKYSNPNQVGYPDRIICLPDGRQAWVELKSKGEHPTPIQAVRLGVLKGLGQNVFVCDSKEAVDNVFKTLGYDI